MVEGKIIGRKGGYICENFSLHRGTYSVSEREMGLIEAIHNLKGRSGQEQKENPMKAGAFVFFIRTMTETSQIRKKYLLKVGMERNKKEELTQLNSKYELNDDILLGIPREYMAQHPAPGFCSLFGENKMHTRKDD